MNIHKLSKKSNRGVAMLWLFVIIIIVSSCKKYLDEKPDKKMVLPETLANARALLDNYTLFNSSYPSIGDQSDDNYFLTEARFNAAPLNGRNYYTWAANANSDLEYSNLYKIILNATIALETVNRVPRDAFNATEWDHIKGTALFYRSYALFNAALYFAEQYDSAGAAQKPGIPLRMSSDAAIVTTRAILAESWQHIAGGLQQAIPLLPVYDLIPSRPNRAAGWAMLAKVWLSMANYKGALAAADSALQLRNDLIDFNSIDSNATAPFSRFNKEVIFPAIGISATQLTPNNYSLDTNLFKLYHPNDLRRAVYFRTNPAGFKAFKANYNGSATGGPFTGLATGEVYLMQAECRARVGMVPQAMEALNNLLEKRWRAGSFVPVTASGKEEALSIILTERRKELILRGTRWFDIKRFNKHDAMGIELKRVIGGNVFILSANSPRYVFLFPIQAINLAGIQQNER